MARVSKPRWSTASSAEVIERRGYAPRSADHGPLGEAVPLAGGELVGAGGEHRAHALVVGHPATAFEVVELAPAAVRDEVAEAQLLVMHSLRELRLDGRGRRHEAVERDAHVDVVGDVHEDRVEEE